MKMKQKKKRKMPSSFTILFLITIFIAVLTWIIPAGQYEIVDGNYIPGTYHQVAQTPQGIFDVFLAPILGMLGTETTTGAIEVSMFILFIGGFLGVVNETGAIDAGIAATIKNNKGNMTRLIWILMFVFALGGTTFGMAEETIPFYSLLIPLMVSVGMDSLVAVATILIGSGLGVLSSTINPFATGIASEMAGISMADGIVIRIIFFIVTYVIGAVYVSRYANKVLADNQNSYIYDQMEEQKELFTVQDSLIKLTPKKRNVLIVFVFAFLVMLLSLIPWSDLNANWTLFEDIHRAIMDTPIFGSIIGQSALPLGHWYLVEITMLFFLMSMIVAMIYGIDESRYVEAFVNGAKDLFDVALIIAVARGIQVIMNDGQITATVLHWGSLALADLPKGLFIVLTYLFYIPMTFLIPSTSGLAAATMGIMAPLGEFAGVEQYLVITAYQAASGVVNLVTPTFGVIVGALAISKISITTWWKFITKLIAIIIAVSIIILVISAYLV